MSIETTIRDYILQNYMFTTDASKLSNGDSLLKKGIIDSTGILELIGYLREEFGVTVEDVEMIPENLDSVNNLTAFVTRKRHTQ